MRGRAALTLVAACVALGACGASVPKLKQPKADTLQTAAERLPLGPPRTAQDAVLKLWSQMRHASLITAMYQYDSRLRREFRTRDILGALSLVRTVFLSAPPRISGQESTPAGRLIYTQSTSEGRTVGFGSYLVKRIGRRWRITYDSTLRDGLVTFTTQQVDRHDAPSSRGPSDAARRAGEAVGRRYLLLFAPHGTTKQRR